MITLIIAAWALGTGGAQTPVNGKTGQQKHYYHVLSKYGPSFVGTMTAAQAKEVDDQVALTAELRARYKAGEVKAVFLLGRQAFEKYLKQKPICGESLSNWSFFSYIYAQACLRLSHLKEARAVLHWTAKWGDDLGARAALDGLYDLKKGDMAGAQEEVKKLKGAIIPSSFGEKEPDTTTKNGLLESFYLIINRFAGAYQDFPLEAQYDALAVEAEPHSSYAYCRYGDALGMQGKFKEAVDVLQKGVKMCHDPKLPMYFMNNELGDYEKALDYMLDQKELGNKSKKSGKGP